MSDPKLITPLLDGFVMGEPISSHDGVYCCPAMKVDSDERYIVKIISVPSDQRKMAALLLAGAFSGREAVTVYYEGLAKEIVEEAGALCHAADLEGFCCYDGWQIVPKEDGEAGFDVYLVAPYRKTLARFLRRNPMTHLAAVNLGLDLCAALSVCRRNGLLYVDLKPENIILTPEREFKIADLGFVKLSSLSYASMPDRYLSAYTAPEIKDAYSSLNDTLDIYAVGLVLYQVYNGGVLPFSQRPSDEPLLPPQFADYEMAQIILKACDPDPAKRWGDPMQMGQALVEYLQRNSINDDPIVPPILEVVPEQEEPIPEESLTEDDDPSTQQVLNEVDEALAAVIVEGEESSIPEEPVYEEPVREEIFSDAASEETGPVSEESATADTEETVSEVAEETVKEEAEVVSEAGEAEEVDETALILAQADELIAHETPEPVIVPAPIEVPMPDLIVEKTENEEISPESDAAEVSDTVPQEARKDKDGSEDEDTDEDEDEDEEDDRHKGKALKGIIIAAIVVIVLATLTLGFKHYYENEYLQPVLGVSVIGEEDWMTVTVNTQIPDELLTVVCTDNYGNTISAPLHDGKADFRNLHPDTRYNISLEISGRHKLIGSTTGSYTTPVQTSIHGISIVTGNEDSEVILSFTVQGTDSSEWIVRYSADGEAERSLTFQGHMTTISGLSYGKTYTFALEPVSSLYMIGDNSASFTVLGILSAQNLQIHGFLNNALYVTWDAPDESQGIIESWTVRCYNGADYDKTITVTDTSARFEGADPALGYTIEVTAAGMSVTSRTYLSAKSVTIHEVRTDLSNPSALNVTWDYEGSAPEGGWLLLYTMGDDTNQYVVQSTTNSAVISPVIPGTTYHLTVRPAGGNTVFGGSGECASAPASRFSGYLVEASNIILRMCRTPQIDNWVMADVPAADFRYQFIPGEKASFALTLDHEYNTSSDNIVTLFVIRDANGHVVGTSTQSRTWTNMWYRGFCRLNIPSLPDAVGSYTLELYFNNMYVSTQQFSIVASL